MANYSCKRFSLQITLSHNTSVTDDRRTDDNHANISTVTQVVVTWRSGNAFYSINEVTVRWARLVLRCDERLRAGR